MASTKPAKKVNATATVPECPVCMEMMTAPIFQCKVGHSLCNRCTVNLPQPSCPICRADMTQMRNWQLEELILKAKMPCPNKSAGCVYVVMQMELEEHLKECIFRSMDCPLGAVFGKCSWNGKLKDMMQHFNERHPSNCNISSDADVELDKVDIREDERYLYLVSQGKLFFIITFKIDTLQKMAYWTIQHIGSKNLARQHVYEIHVTSQHDARKKAVFTDHCFNDAIKADDVFRMGKCAMIPLQALSHYVKNKKLTFRFFVKKIPFVPKNKGDKPADNNNSANKPQQKKGPKPHFNKAQKGPGPKQNNN